MFFSAEFLGRSIIDFILEISRGVLQIYSGQILAEILEKGIDTEIYSTVKHVAKGLNLNNITLPQEINAMINLDNYVYRGK